MTYFNPDKVKWSAPGKFFALLLGIPMVAVGWGLQVFVALIITIGNLFFSPVDMLFGFVQRSVRAVGP
jgi:hypothetical protein